LGSQREASLGVVKPSSHRWEDAGKVFIVGVTSRVIVGLPTTASRGSDGAEAAMAMVGSDTERMDFGE
jgi:hypothetical protein